jgi:hypothetical protein
VAAVAAVLVVLLLVSVKVAEAGVEVLRLMFL